MKKTIDFSLLLFFPLLFSCIEDEEINTEQDFAEMTVECGNVLALSNGMVVEKRDSFYVFQGDIYFTEDDILKRTDYSSHW